MRILHVFHKVHEIVISVCLVPIRLYQRFISPLKGQPSCRFSPTCSQYCVEAVREWGILIGAALTLWRVLRCNPFGKGGFDPVPRRKRRQRTQTEKSPRL
ncbi:MAG: membrane protein insertion efficiency factor YidD [Eubacteriales bacterium]|nr:membrane protein insertion efficiency factor YidD [Clostridiales bacterium]MDD7773915.1 membrane protein insertion efficiency factor YidD [Eubacteriales bacterium]MDY3941867.1 membrane protein insertion efficiency factor YidD [Eubacteriales bacterium]